MHISIIGCGPQTCGDLAVKIGDRLVFFVDGKLFFKEMSSLAAVTSISHDPFEGRVTGLLRRGGCLVVVFGAFVKVFALKEDGKGGLSLLSIDSFGLDGAPLRYIDVPEGMVFLLNENRVRIRTKKGTEIVFVSFGGERFTIRDMCSCGDSYYALSGSGRVYPFSGFALSKKISFKRPFAMVPESPNLFNSGLIVNNRKFVVFGSEGFRVFTKMGDVLLCKYTYNGIATQFCSVGQNVLCACTNGVMKINNAPEMLVATDSARLFDDVIVSSSMLAVVGKESPVSPVLSREEPAEMIFEGSAIERTERLLKGLSNFDMKACLNSAGILNIDDAINKMGEEIIKMCSDVYAEIKATAETFPDKIEVLNGMKREINRKVEELDRRRKSLCKKQILILDTIKRMKEAHKPCFGDLAEKVGEVKTEMRKNSTKNISLLKTQKNILMGMISGGKKWAAGRR